MSDLYLLGYNIESIADGFGVRTVLFISGCTHNCEECHSPQTHSFTNGTLIDDKFIDFINKEMKKRPYLSGLTLSGGDPMCSADKVLNLLDKLYVPKDDIWCYSGYVIDEIRNDKSMNRLLDKCSHLVDGKFDISKRDITHMCKFRGSTNQIIWEKSDTDSDIWLNIDNY